MSAESLFDELAAAELGRPGVTMGRALSRDGLMVGGKLYAFVAGQDQLVVKVPATRVQELTESGVGGPMSMGTRVMREWAAVPFGSTAGEVWPPLVDEARSFVATLPATPARRKRGEAASRKSG